MQMRKKKGAPTETPFFIPFSFLLLELEADRYAVPYVHGFTALFAGFPKREHLDDPDCLFIERRVNAPDHGYLVNGALVCNAEAKYHLTLDVVFLGQFGILDVVIDEFEELNVPTGE